MKKQQQINELKETVEHLTMRIDYLEGMVRYYIAMYEEGQKKPLPWTSPTLGEWWGKGTTVTATTNIVVTERWKGK